MNISQKKRILLITPVLPEFHAAREIFGARELSSDGKFRLAEKTGGVKRIRILQSGPGAAALVPYKTQLAEFKPDLVIDSGSCGALRENLSPGSILFIGKVCREGGGVVKNRMGEGAISLPPDCIRSSILETAEPVLTSERRNTLKELSDAVACSMESFLVAEEADALSIDWIGFRIVTDGSNERTAADFKKNIRRFSLDLYADIRLLLDQKG